MTDCVQWRESGVSGAASMPSITTRKGLHIHVHQQEKGKGEEESWGEEEDSEKVLELQQKGMREVNTGKGGGEGGGTIEWLV